MTLPNGALYANDGYDQSNKGQPLISLKGLNIAPPNHTSDTSASKT